MYNIIRGDFKMINFKEEVEKRKDQLIQDIETLCAIPSVYDEKTASENQPYGKACRNALDAMLETENAMVLLLTMNMAMQDISISVIKKKVLEF